MAAKGQAILKDMKTMSGRQTAKMVYEWFKTDEHMSQMYGHNDIQNLPWGGG